jgi:plasmid replication initiation protein
MLSQGGDVMPTLKKNHLIQKRNVLNEIRANNMTLQELRFFSIYLSKIHKDRPEETRVVRFPMDDFKAIMELGRIDINYMKGVANSLLCKVVNVPLDSGGFTAFQLFKECTVSNDHGEWYVEIDAHDKALPLMFEFKNRYFSYQLWNALRLRSSNQLRMYEILKQYQTKGFRILTVDELKELLGIGKDEYPRFNDLKKWVIDACQQAIREYTDIKFTYEPHGKRGKGGKIQSLKFIIEKNDDYIDQLTLDMFIEEKVLEAGAGYAPDKLNLNDINSDESAELLEAGAITQLEDKLIFLRDAVNGEFTIEQITVLYDIVIRDIPELLRNDKWQECYHHFMSKHNYVKEKYSNGEIKYPFGYLKSIIGKT